MDNFTIQKKLGKFTFIPPSVCESSPRVTASTSSDFNTLFVMAGAGSFSEVYQVTRKNDKIIYAMKKVKM